MHKKESTKPLRNRFPLSWLTTSSICKWLKIILYKPLFVPCQSLSGSQTHLCFSTEADAWTCFVWTDIFLVQQDVNPSKMPHWRAEEHGLPGWENGCTIPSAKSCLWGWNYMLGNYTVAEITACCWQKEKILLFTPFTTMHSGPGYTNCTGSGMLLTLYWTDSPSHKGNKSSFLPGRWGWAGSAKLNT